MKKIRILTGKWVPVIGLSVTIISYGFITYLAVLLGSLQFETTPLPHKPPVEDVFFLVYANYLEYTLQRGILWLGIAASYLFLPGLVSALLSLPVSLAWRLPLRVLVLRRFGARKRSRSLRKALRQRVAPMGHVYTLADRDFKTPWYIRFPLIFAQLVFLHFRERRIRSPRGIRRVSSSLDVLWARNINWVVSFSKAFSLRSSDTVWRDLVQSLTAKVEAVLIDVHEGSPNLEWEIRKCVEENYLHKTMFMTPGDRREEAVCLLAKLGLGHLTGDKLVVYDTVGLEEDARLRTFLESRQALEPRPGRARLTSHFKAASVMIGPILWVLILFVALHAFLGEDRHPEANRFGPLVGRLRQKPTRDAAFGDLHRAVSISGTTHSAPWIDDFDKAVTPELKELWEDEPGRRREILAVLKDAGTPGGAEIWKRALSDAGQVGGLTFDEVIGGIAAARSTKNLPDLLKLFRQGEPDTRLKVLRALGELGDNSVVPILLADIILQPEGAQPLKLMQEATSALQKILRPKPPLRAIGPNSKPAALIAVLSCPGSDQASLLYRLMPFIANSHWKQHNTNFRGTEPKIILYGKIETRDLLVSYPTTAGYRVFQEFPDLRYRWSGLMEYGERLDAVLLEVSATRGIDALVKQHVAVAHMLGIPRVAVLINTGNAPLETGRLASLERELHELLGGTGFVDSNVVIVAGPVPNVDEIFNDNAARTGVKKLFAAIDAWPTRPALAERPTRFPIGGVFQIPDKGTLVTGFLEQGVLSPGDVLEVAGDTAGAQVVAGERLDFPGSDDVVGLWIRDGRTERLRAGQVLAQPGTLTAHDKFAAWAYVLSEEEGGPRNLVVGTIGGVQEEKAAFSPGAVFAFQFCNAFVSPKHLRWGSQVDTPPEELRLADFKPARGWVTLEVSLEYPVPIQRGQRFRLFSDGELVAAGAVTEVIE